MAMDRSEALALLDESRVGRLATIRPDGGPHIVPITFAVVDRTVVTMVDQKPKTTTKLQRLANIDADHRVGLLVDQWSEDWRRLRWARFDGTAEIHHDDSEHWEIARDALVARYDQYRDQPPNGPVIVITIENVTGWASTG
jgi:PPOX class probable F420-dependent enzyme